MIKYEPYDAIERKVIFMYDIWDNLKVLGIILIVIGVGMMICNIGLSTLPVAEVNDFTIGYLSESDYNDGNYDEADITSDAVFTKGTPQYMVIDFKIKTISDDVGKASVKIMPRVSDNTAVTMMIQEAPTGNVETRTFADGTRSYELSYKVPENKDEEKTVRMILKLLPNASGEFKFDIYADGKVKGDTRTSISLHINAAD